MNIVVVGMGYVGCPLAYELSKTFNDVVGFDIDSDRIKQLATYDRTNELTVEQVQSAGWKLSDDPTCLETADVIIVTVPTPITTANVPDLQPVIKATEMIAKHLKPGTTIVYESTVYPGVTEEICVPILAAVSNLTYLKDFNVGYSPERINPGDRVNTLTTVTKIVSGDTSETLELVDSIYSKITKTYRAQSIKIAEAAKVIENTQRDVNIALMNELSAIFDRLKIDTNDVINAAATKWNFLPFRPGLVGGHCISVDPYYLTHRAQAAGYIPSLILAAREVNDQAPVLLASKTLQALGLVKRLFAGTVIKILGCTFKENVPDIRNSKVFTLILELEAWGVEVCFEDPWAHPQDVQHEHGDNVWSKMLPPQNKVKAHAVILAVAHDEYVNGGWDLIKQHLVDGPNVVTDLKGVLNRDTKPENTTLVRP